MKYRNFIYTLAIVISALLTFAARNATAQTTANGPYYAWPSWDQTLPSSTRFIVLSNFNSQAVLDRETGLVWERSPSIPAFATSWQDALVSCNNIVVGNRKGWRLPTVQELASLVDPSVAAPGPTLPNGHPFQAVAAAIYWSATESRTLIFGEEPSAWSVSFSSGLVNERPRGADARGWCVRGGQGVDPQ